MPSDLKLTAAGILAHVLETSGIHVGTTIDRKDLENMAASLDDQLSALIAAAKRVEAAERQKRIACGVADKLGERLRASNARATAAEARVGQLIEALIASHTDIGHWLQLARYQREKMDQNLGWCPTEGGIVRSEMVRSQISTALLNAELARTALKPQGEAALDELTAETERLGLYMPQGKSPCPFCHAPGECACAERMKP